MAMWPGRPAERALVEDVGDQTHVLDDGDRPAVGHRDARRLLARGAAGRRDRGRSGGPRAGRARTRRRPRTPPSVASSSLAVSASDPSDRASDSWHPASVAGRSVDVRYKPGCIRPRPAVTSRRRPRAGPEVHRCPCPPAGRGRNCRQPVGGWPGSRERGQQPRRAGGLGGVGPRCRGAMGVSRGSTGCPGRGGRRGARTQCSPPGGPVDAPWAIPRGRGRRRSPERAGLPSLGRAFGVGTAAVGAPALCARSHITRGRSAGRAGGESRACGNMVRAAASWSGRSGRQGDRRRPATIAAADLGRRAHDLALPGHEVAKLERWTPCLSGRRARRCRAPRRGPRRRRGLRGALRPLLAERLRPHPAHPARRRAVRRGAAGGDARGLAAGPPLRPHAGLGQRLDHDDRAPAGRGPRPLRGGRAGPGRARRQPAPTSPACRSKTTSSTSSTASGSARPRPR